MADLKPAEVEKAKMHFDVYDFDGTGKIDAGLVCDVIRSMDIAIEQEHITKNGGTLKKGEKMIPLEEFLPIFSACKKEKDLGSYGDLMEGLKVYDKNENGTVMLGEIMHICCTLGEKLTDPEVEEVMKCCAGEEDDDGFIQTEPFLRALFAGPYPEGAEAK